MESASKAPHRPLHETGEPTLCQPRDTCDIANSEELFEADEGLGVAGGGQRQDVSLQQVVRGARKLAGGAWVRFDIAGGDEELSAPAVFRKRSSSSSGWKQAPNFRTAVSGKGSRSIKFAGDSG